MAVSKQGIRVEGAKEAARAFRKLDKDGKKDARQEIGKVSAFLSGRIRSAASSTGDRRTQFVGQSIRLEEVEQAARGPCRQGRPYADVPRRPRTALVRPDVRHGVRVRRHRHRHADRPRWRAGLAVPCTIAAAWPRVRGLLDVPHAPPRTAPRRLDVAEVPRGVHP